ncbi:MAG: sugar ABC transporter substrate-binding protein [Chloroflexia bacterium]|nr:sugar ABC transporter substrate-binding protein [Chloroflexia bacterium]
MKRDLHDLGRHVAKLGSRGASRRAVLRAGVAGGATATAASLTGSRHGQRSARAQDAVTISYGYWDVTQEAAVEAQIAAFQEANPNITVSAQVTPWADYWTKLQTGVAGGESWDVFWLNTANLPVFASQDGLVNLQPLVDDGSIEVDAFPASLIEAYSYEGSLYAASRDVDTIGLYYNSELFDTAGIDYPNDEWTWEDLRSAAEALTIGSGDSAEQWGFAVTTSFYESLTGFILQNEGRYWNDELTESQLAEPAAAEAINYLSSFIDDGLSPSTDVQLTNNPFETLFPAGRVAMITGGSWRPKPLYEANPAINVALLPIGKIRAAPTHGLGHAVWSGSQHPEEASQFVVFLTSAEGEQILADSGATLPSREGMAETWLSTVPEVDLEVFIETVTEYAVAIPNGPDGSEWSSAIVETLTTAWGSGGSTEDLPQQLADAANATL